MKKLLVLITAALLITTTGCMSIDGIRFMKETKEYLAKEDYTMALIPAKHAIAEGCKDKDFIKMTDILKNYREAYYENDLEQAERYINKIKDSDIAEIKYFDDTNMIEAVNELKKNIHEKMIDEKIKELEKYMREKNYNLAGGKADNLLEEEELTDWQKQKIQRIADEAHEKSIEEIHKIWDSVKNPTPTSPTYPKGKAYDVNLTEQEAIDAARKAMSEPNASATVQLIGDYYLVNFTEQIDIGDEIITDESCCKVDCTTGEVYDQAG